MGGVKVGNQETARVGGNRFTQAQSWSSMAPTGPVFVFGWSVLPVRDEKIGFLRELGEGLGEEAGGSWSVAKTKERFFSAVIPSMR